MPTPFQKKSNSKPIPPRESKCSLLIKNTSKLITPEDIRLKILIYAVPGFGKTSFLSSVPDIGVAACETGQGKGLLSIAGSDIDFCEPANLKDFSDFCKGTVFPNKTAAGIDSLTYMSNNAVKEAALLIPRMRGDSGKRKEGIPELDDYQVMAEMTRRLLSALLSQDKHVVCTATEKMKMPDAETGVGEIKIGPDLPGQMFEGSAAMFDLVLRGRTRQKLRDPKDPKSRYTERYFVTQPDGAGTIAKTRANKKGVPLLDKEEIYDLSTGQGCFPYILNKILEGYK